MKKINLNFLFADQVGQFAHLLTTEPMTRDKFAETIGQHYDKANPKTALFYQSILLSTFDTIRLNQTRDAILLNQ